MSINRRSTRRESTRNIYWWKLISRNRLVLSPLAKSIDQQKQPTIHPIGPASYISPHHRNFTNNLELTGILACDRAPYSLILAPLTPYEANVRDDLARGFIYGFDLPNPFRAFASAGRGICCEPWIVLPPTPPTEDKVRPRPAWRAGDHWTGGFCLYWVERDARAYSGGFLFRSKKVRVSFANDLFPDY